MGLYQVYVVELSKKVFTEDKKFREANPQYNGVLECLYVGMTSKDPTRRFKEHKEKLMSKKGHYLSSSIVKKYGLYLRPSLYAHIDRGNKKRILEEERKLALSLRKKRYAVWFN